MTASELGKVLEAVKCRVLGSEDAGNDGHRLALAILAQTFNSSESALLCEPSLARKTTRPPDIVLIDPEIGVHVFEVKGISMDQIEGIEAGGQLRIRYASGVRSRNAIAQVRNHMFDIKDATVRAFHGEVRLSFRYWVVFPQIRRSAWLGRFGADGFCPDELLFSEDLEPLRLSKRIGASDRITSNHPIKLCALDELEAVWRAFGDTSVLYATPEERTHRRTEEGTLGEHFDESAETYKQLSDEQQRLSAMNWDGGPRLVRGVAGSGKTIVLANNLARRLERMLIARSEGLFAANAPPPRLLAVCFNRKLAPFIEKKISIAFQQRTGRSVPEGMVEVCAFNKLMYRLTTAGLWKYKSVENADDIVRAMHYLDDLQHFRERNPERLLSLSYDAIYVDEGQDFLEEEFRLLKELCRTTGISEPNLYVFYDDAQNLYGRARPNWQSLGLNVRGGRSFVMNQCFRNPRKVIEASFNVLYGTCAMSETDIPSKEFGDITAMQQKQLIKNDQGFWEIEFAHREGATPRISIAESAYEENEIIISRLRWLIEDQQVRPEDILVLAFSRHRVESLAVACSAAGLAGVHGIHIAMNNKDHPLGAQGHLTFSTVASAKGYDAYCVLLASANEFPTDVLGRASFYVGCTRAIEHLEVFANKKAGLAQELETVLARMAK